jgi:aminoglycoside/choline kinase family phosphotransferase
VIALARTPVSPLLSPLPQADFAPLAALVARTFSGAPLVYETMPGGASSRRYFRLNLPSGKGTIVAMYVPEGAKADEVTNDAAHPRARWPFLEVRDLLASRGIDVPALVANDAARGWLLLEDLGDLTLAQVVARDPSRREELYARAVNDLARAQAMLVQLPEGSIVASRAFDEELLSWEIHHFREWGLEARGIALSAKDRALFAGIAERLARRVAGFARTFVHRDYQSRNLMVRPDGRLCWIDFQDALLGPRVYDLVSLLNDSYQTFDRPFVLTRLDDYARTRGLDAAQRQAIAREFDWVTVQRKLKDAGRFVFIDRVKGNDTFLKFVEPTMAKVRAALAGLRDHEDMRALGDFLTRVLP